MNIFNNGILEVLLHGETTSDPEVEKRVQDALEEAGIDLGVGSAKVQRKLNGINVEFEEHFAPELESGPNTALKRLSEFGISFAGEIECYGDCDGYIVVDDKNWAVSMDKEEYGLRTAPTERLVDILESRGFGVVRCASMAQARKYCFETREWLQKKLAKEVAEAAAMPMKSVQELIEEAAGNKLEDSK